MADVIVEDGSQVANADSYISVANATAYLAGVGKADAWDLVDDKDAALRKATQYMTQQYRFRWAGTRVSSTQRLDWPRAWVPITDVPSGYGALTYIAVNVVPADIGVACAEFALQSNTADLNPNLERAQSSVKVGEIAITYDPNSPEEARYRAMDQLLAPYLKPGGMVNTKLERA